jgi:para-aminobenzoate synthetase/4-amino-4-deoxychorismate lyase
MGFHFEKIVNQRAFDFPIAWFGVYQEPQKYETWVKEKSVGKVVGVRYSIQDVRFCLSNADRATTLEEYSDKIETIRRCISEGDVYQINLTGKIQFSFNGSPLAFYEDLKRKQKVSYNAFLQTDYGTIVSLSPELFFRRRRNTLVTRPMKGTAPRGKTLAEDGKIRDWLKNDEKSRAENIMIVDILRNDMAKVSKVGSVKTSALCEVERYETLFQMVSTIESQLQEDVPYYDIFKALFPSGSVTGAPKIRAMQIINELEQHHRGVYTGAIGFISPKKEAVFNVPIRTILLNESKGEMGTGGGIVWDSNSEQEYKECLLKAKFLTEPFEEFSLLETIRWNGSYPLLEKHIARLRASAEYFGFVFDEQQIRQSLYDVQKEFEQGKSYKVRLLLNDAGEVSIQTSYINEVTQRSKKVCLSAVRTNSSNTFLFHKTTNRRLYDRMYHIAQQKGYADVLFFNDRGELTEGAISNVLIKKNGKYSTPPVECGLLNGISRQHLFETLDNLEEEIIFLENLRSVNALYLCNAIKGLQEVTLVEEFIEDDLL